MLVTYVGIFAGHRHPSHLRARQTPRPVVMQVHVLGQGTLVTGNRKDLPIGGRLGP